MSLFQELKRRNVFKVASVYLITAWLIIQIISVVSPYLHLPIIFGTITTVVLAIGFPIAMIFAWAFELTPQGLKKTKHVDKDTSITHVTGKKLSITLSILLAFALFFIAYDKLIATKQTETIQTQQTAEHSTDDLTIAVLPFVNMSTDKENEFFADGLTEEILNKLARVAKLQVTARTSAFQYKNSNEDLRIIGERLGVSYILEGSVRKSNNIARITAQLIRTSDGFHLWSDTYDSELDNVFTVQDNIANEVTEALDIILDEGARAEMHQAGIGDVQAFIAFQKGVETYNEAHSNLIVDIQILEQANQYFDITIEQAPKFQDSYIYKTDYYGHIFLTDEVKYSIDDKLAALQQLQQLFAQVIANERNKSLKAVYQMSVTMFSNDWRKLPVYKNNISDMDFCANIQWFDMLRNLGYGELTHAMAEQGIKCDPLNGLNRLILIFETFHMGLQEQARQIIAGYHQEQDAGNGYEVIKVLTYLAENNIAEAVSIIKQVKPSPLKIIGEAFIAAAKGDKQQIEQAIEALRANRDGSRSHLSEDLVHANYLGDRETANRIASKLDNDPAGPFHLLQSIVNCSCGATFDIDSTPNFKKRIEEAQLTWPPKTLIKFPLKDW
ncbi:hypothetical protein E2K93_15965 [Thalassotalea sp. HSM 43]|uniref:hypothetical protein n=1 Tax=Thalassotalea sp. HSM 43 TaxID=2552945 RepID=UPI0010801BA1|nr:hypothetical protein [Thalassotalea sp. HSM 43]QBY05764.1 hypothetical protein E2K93_15965 [Thalassotalea sp. HSM 43]